MLRLRCLLPLLLLFFVFPNQAKTQTIDLSSLANHETWQKLLKYEINSEYPNGVLSAIHSEAFFFADNGRIAPLDELRATIKAFQAPIANHVDPNAFPQCLFPARYMWLQKMLGDQANFQVVEHCPEFDEWQFNGATESISVVFATGYLGNPASFYGHTLLKMNSSLNRNSAKIEDVSVNYGAIVPDDENMLKYIVKGVFGGYEAGFSHVEYYFHTHNYGENELRDLWEYELDLSQEEVNFVLAHTWEVLRKKYTYYFFRHNCSYRMAELLEIIPGIKVIPDNPLFVMPQVLMQEIAKHTDKGRELVKQIRVDESRQSKLYSAWEQLPGEHKNWVEDIIADTSLLKSDAFLSLSQADRKRITEALMHYFLFLKETVEEDRLDEVEQHYKETLMARFALPSGKSEMSSTVKVPPHEGRDPSYVAFGLSHVEGKSNAAYIRYRPAYYDELDAGGSHVQYSGLSMADLDVAIADDEIRLRHFNFVTVNSFNAQATGLPGDENNTWRLAFGFRQQQDSCGDCITPYVEGYKGMGFNISDNIKVSVAAGGGLQNQSDGLGNAYAATNTKVVSQLSDSLSVMAQWRKRVFYDGDTRNDDLLQIDLRYKLSRNSDVRVSYAKTNLTEVRLSFGQYF